MNMHFIADTPNRRCKYTNNDSINEPNTSTAVNCNISTNTAKVSNRYTKN